MVEVPEHLRRRAEEARAKAEAAKAGGGAQADIHFNMLILNISMHS